MVVLAEKSASKTEETIMNDLNTLIGVVVGTAFFFLVYCEFLDWRSEKQSSQKNVRSGISVLK
jgi:hypothetical protein